MKKDREKILITPDEAITLLPDGDQIHTFRSGTGILIGADWSRKSIIEALRNNPDMIEIGGDGCKSMGHGLVCWTSNTDPLFIEADKDKVFEMESQAEKL